MMKLYECTTSLVSMIQVEYHMDHRMVQGKKGVAPEQTKQERTFHPLSAFPKPAQISEALFCPFFSRFGGLLSLGRAVTKW
jgi:hypothetical protein